MAIPLYVAMAGTAVSAWQKYKAGEAESGAYKDMAKAKRRAAANMMERAKLNTEFTRLSGESFKGKQLGALAASGIDVGSGIALSMIEDTAKKIERRVRIDEMEVESRRDMLLMEADLDWGRAKSSLEAGKKDAIGTLAGGFMGAF